MSNNDPVVIVNDKMIDAAMPVAQSVLQGCISDDAIGALVVGVFMAMLDNMEDGKVVFAYSEDGPFMRWNAPSIN